MSYYQGFEFDPFSIAKGMILALLRSQGYGCENLGRTPPSKFFGVPRLPGIKVWLFYAKVIKVRKHQALEIWFVEI